MRILRPLILHFAEQYVKSSLILKLSFLILKEQYHGTIFDFKETVSQVFTSGIFMNPLPWATNYPMSTISNFFLQKLYTFFLFCQQLTQTGVRELGEIVSRTVSLARRFTPVGLHHKKF